MKRLTRTTAWLLSGLLLMGSLSGCGESFLEEEPKTFISTNAVLSSPEGLEGAIVALYAFPRLLYQSPRYSYWFISGTDEVRVGPLHEDLGTALYNSDLNPQHPASREYWNQSFQALYRANAIIANTPKVDFKGNEARRNRVLAEARFFRAYILFYLHQRYGNIPLVTEPSETIREKEQPAPAEEIYHVIVEDLQFAINNLDWTYNQPGRITKGAAMHLLAKVYLVLQNWQQAGQLAETLIQQGPYRLLSDPAAIFADGNEDNAEAIWTIKFDPRTGGGHFLAPMFTPLYDRIQGVRRSFEQGGRPWARMYPSAYLLSLFDKNDKRLKAWYKTHWVYDAPEEGLPPGRQVGDTVRAKDFNPPIDSLLWLHPACKKYWEYGSTRNINAADSWKGIIRYRLAETYLIAAEAFMRQGNQTKALQYINALRQRAGVADLTQLNEDLLLEEHARELAFEGDRWFTLKRMGRLVQHVRLYNPQAAPNIQDYHVNMPIPQEFVDLTGFPQNTGYH